MKLMLGRGESRNDSAAIFVVRNEICARMLEGRPLPTCPRSGGRTRCMKRRSNGSRLRGRRQYIYQSALRCLLLYYTIFEIKHFPAQGFMLCLCCQCLICVLGYLCFLFDTMLLRVAGKTSSRELDSSSQIDYIQANQTCSCP